MRSQSNLSNLQTRLVTTNSSDKIFECSTHKMKSRSEILLANPDVDAKLSMFIEAYRNHGHKKASFDPLGLTEPWDVPELDPERYGVKLGDLVYNVAGLLNVNGQDTAKGTDIVKALEEMYCGALSIELQHIPHTAEKEWLSQRFEELKTSEMPNSEKEDLGKLLYKSQAFDHFVANKFSTVKRYGGEGAESVMAFYNHLFTASAKEGISDVVVAIAHRGRLNFLSCLMDFPMEALFRKMQGKSEFPDSVAGTGDVVSHSFNSVDLDIDGTPLHITMVPNPSHLEAANPVAVGKARTKMQMLETGDYSGGENPHNSVLCLQVHGDAAFSAQGVVSETLAMANVPHYSVGGSVHIIINNQIGFTTEQHLGRSSLYTSCVGKINNCPVIRVNADHPEEVVKACQLAVEYRQRYGKDVIVDYICYRRWGHNEVDEPGFTQPLMYSAIRARKSIPETYGETLVESGVCSAESLQTSAQAFNTQMSEAFNTLPTCTLKARHLERQWSGLVQASDQITTWDTGVDPQLLKYVGARSVTLPEDFNVHSTLKKTHIDRRFQKLEEGTNLDWATAEALAMGSLLYQGYHVRLSGQDVGRGTFSHRHAMFVDQDTDHTCIPLNYISPQQEGFFEVCNSILSEEAVLGFEYGVSIESPKVLPMWEAQFGDFFNGAQIIIDAFIASGEAKWLMQSGLVMLLPHGMDGAGPEHSSCRIERFLQLSDSKEDGVDGDNVNMQVVNPTTPAQYFHLLRRQMVRNFRKPLIVAGPKVLLRHPSATSDLSQMAPGTSFLPVLSDPVADPAKVTRLVFVSGKHYYTLAKEREIRGASDTAFVRLESLSPFPVEEIRAEINKYSNATDFMWAQEEHRNQGAWNFVNTRFENVVGKKLRYTGRGVLPVPATGIGEVHKRECDQLMQDVFM